RVLVLALVEHRQDLQHGGVVHAVGLAQQRRDQRIAGRLAQCQRHVVGDASALAPRQPVLDRAGQPAEQTHALEAGHAQHGAQAEE
ncbi:hypothetical protein DKP78_21635, partial [Enterococcus faecium]